MKRILSILTLLSMTIALCASPAKPVKRTITIDGKQITVTLRGDETLHYWQAEDGRAFRQLPDSSYVLIDVTAARNRINHRSEATGVPAPGRIAPQRRTSSHVDPILGEKRGLVILVNTQDIKFTCSDDPHALFNDMMNKEGFNYNKATGSVRDYFRDQSYGKLDYQFDVVGPVTVSQKMSYYGDNNKYDYESACVGEMIKEAISLVDKDVNFKLYDCDGDGEVENIYLIYAGYSEAAGAPDWTIWPHAYRLQYINYWNKNVNRTRRDGVWVDAYAISSEYRGTSGNKIDGIGTICHEFSHCLGLPDFYSTVNAHNDYTNSYWSLLDTGTYGNDGDTPCSYTAYERWFCGWIEPKELTTDTVVNKLTNLDKSGEAYVYYNEGNRNEFYILHNIQRTGWNKYAAASGLSVWHADVDDHAWAYDEVNNYPDHLRMQMFCADNKYSFQTVSGDLYPSGSNNKLTDSSKPAATVFNTNIDGTNYMGKNLYNISLNTKGEISFRFTVNARLKEALAIEDITVDSQNQKLKTQNYYNLQGQRVSPGYKGIVIRADGKKIRQ